MAIMRSASSSPSAIEMAENSAQSAFPSFQLLELLESISTNDRSPTDAKTDTKPIWE